HESHKYISTCQLFGNSRNFCSDLVSSGAQFEIELSKNAGENDDFLGGESGDSDYEDALDGDHEQLIYSWKQSFNELRSVMLRINEHIYKRTTREGHKDRDLVPDKARVFVRYSGYWEGEGAPFDSSMLRGTKFAFETGQRQVLEGLEAAVRTMRPYEQAEFIISYHLLFRELGCPPRIKPKADALFKVEVVDFCLIGDARAFEEVAAEDRDKFCVVYPKAKDMHLHGKDCVKRCQYNCAATAFEKAVNSLNYCRLANDEEELKQTQLLITLYQNLMICYNKVSKPQRVCIIMKALRRLTENRPSCKALFQEGRALTALGEYDCARKIFLQAQIMEPRNIEISEELLSVDKRINKYNEASRDLWSRALSLNKKAEVLTMDAKDKKALEDFIERFEKMDLKSIGMSRKFYSDSELKIFRDLIKDRHMKLTMSPIYEDLLTLSKLQIE
ncbi:hypothetical protein KR009_011832, partial [Drosophila setifemur]